MIVINGSVTEEVKQRLKEGKCHPVARRHADLIIAGCCYAGCRKLEIIVTGTETITYRGEYNLIYYKNNDMINIPHDDIVCATCTHGFKWGAGDVVATVQDKEFIFNYTKASGIGTGNTSFRDDALFTSSADSKAWLKEQYENGTPVTITVYIKE